MTWIPCDNCGAKYRSTEAALRCCSDEFEDDDHDDDLSPSTVDEHGGPQRLAVTGPNVVDTWGVA